MIPLSATELGQGLDRAEIDPVALIDALFDKIAACDDAAIFIELMHDRARAEASAARKRQREGARRSPLDGVPVAWKDLFDIEGRVTTAGSVVLSGNPPADQDAALVAAAAQAGMISVGMLNLTEFAYSGIGLNPHYGTPRNPHGGGQARVPGGSSSASGVVVARNLLPLAVGTDTGGSVRIPASFNGVVGYKSSTGRYPMDGVFPLSRSLDTLGPLAHTVADCALFDAVVRGNAAAPEAMPMTEIEIIVPQTLVHDACQPAVSANFEAALARLAAAGAKIRRLPLTELAEIPALIARLGHIQAAEALALHHERVNGPDAARMDARVVRRIRQAETMSAVDLLLFEEERRRLTRAVAAQVGTAFVAFPTTPHVAMPIAPLEADQELFFETNARTLRNTMLGNFLDWCGVSIPSGFDADGMPTGFLLSAVHGRDAAVLSAALSAEPLVRGDDRGTSNAATPA
ncbi:MAG: amidase [Pararhodobacter sp.]|nr:amidase [Pararhodobacter sp.]